MYIFIKSGTSSACESNVEFSLKLVLKLETEKLMNKKQKKST